MEVPQRLGEPIACLLERPHGESCEIFEMRGKKRCAAAFCAVGIFMFVHNDCAQPPSESPRYPGKNDQL